MRITVLASLVVAMIVPAPLIAGETAGIDHITTTYTGTPDFASCQRMAEMVCCHCYSTLSNGSRFYHGILEAGNCRAHRGYCEGYAKCFP